MPKEGPWLAESGRYMIPRQQGSEINPKPGSHLAYGISSIRYKSTKMFKFC